MEIFKEIEDFEHYLSSIRESDLKVAKELQSKSAILWFHFVHSIYEIVKEEMGLKDTKEVIEKFGPRELIAYKLGLHEKYYTISELLDSFNLEEKRKVGKMIKEFLKELRSSLKTDEGKVNLSKSKSCVWLE